MKRRIATVIASIIAVLALGVFAVACGDISPDALLDAHYKVTYSIGEGATGTAPDEEMHKGGEKFTLPAATGFEKSGYTFDKWNDGANDYAAGADYTMPYHAVTLTATWTENAPPPAPVNRTVTFNPNNADTPVTWTETVTSGQTVAKPATDPTNPNCKVFRYWQIEVRTGVYAEYDFSAPVNGDITLYAAYAWKLSFEPGDGATGTVDPIFTEEWIEDTVIIPAANGFSKPGLAFKQWTDGTKTYKPGQYYNGTGNHTLTAVWGDAATGLTLTYGVGPLNNSNVEGTDPASMTLNEGDPITLPANPYTIKPGNEELEFKGWYVQGLVSLLYQPGEVIKMPDKSTSILARFDAKKITITYKSGPHATGDDVIKTDVYAGRITLDTNPFTVDNGYTFKDWAVEGTSEAITRFADKTYKVTDNIVFYAFCEHQIIRRASNFRYEIKLCFDGSGSEFTPESPDTKTAITACTLSGNNLSITLEGNNYTGTLVNNELTLALRCNGKLYTFGEPTLYTVTFDPNNEVDAPTTVTLIPGEKVAKPETDPTISNGKLFRYWKDDDTSAEFDFNTAINANTDLTAVYAYKATFDVNGATGSVEPIWVTIWTPGIVLPAATGLTNGDKVFGGWNDGTNTYAAGERYNGSGNPSFTAVWKDGYTVTFKPLASCSEGTAPAPITGKQTGDTITLPANMFTTKTGYDHYEFKGWYVSGASSVLYQPGDTYVMPANDIVFFAKFDAKIITVTYKAGAHGTGTDVVDNNVKAGNVTLNYCTFTPDNGYMFAGWAIEGTSTAIGLGGDKYSIKTNTTLVALWMRGYFGYDNEESTGLDLDFDNSNGDFYIYDTETELSVTACSLSGNDVSVTIGGKTFTGTLVNNELNLALRLNGKLYTFGEPTLYTVTFDPNNGDNATTVKLIPGEKATRPATDPVHADGKLFRYWKDDDTSAEFDFNTAINANTDLTAVYGYRVSFDVNGATGSVDPIWVTVSGQSVFLPDGTGLTNSDKVFGGWTDGTDTYAADDRYVVTANKEFTAIWNEPAVGYTVTFTTQWRGEGTPPAPLTGKQAGDTITLPANTFTAKAEYSNYVFTGWYIQDAPSVLYQPDETFTMPAKDITVYAKWEAGATPPPQTKFTVTFKPGTHGTGSNDVWSDRSGSIALPDCTFTAANGYVFNGWKLEGGTEEDVYRVNATYSLSADVTFIAQWLHATLDYSNDYAGYLQLFYDAGEGGLFYGDSDYVGVTACSLNGTAVSVTVGGNTFTGTLVNNVLNITITYNSTSYVFGSGSQVTPPPSGPKYTVTVVLTDDDSKVITGTAPVIADKAEGETFTVDASGLSCAHYHLNKWKIMHYVTNGAESGWQQLNTVDPTATITMPGENIQIVGRWVANDVTISFDANGGTGTMEDVTHQYNTNMTLTSNKFDCKFTGTDNKTFQGWALTSNGSIIENGTKLDSNIVGNLDTVTFYAIWDAPTPPVTGINMSDIVGTWTGTKEGGIATETITIVATDAFGAYVSGVAILQNRVMYVYASDARAAFAVNDESDNPFTIEYSNGELIFECKEDYVKYTFTSKAATGTATMADFTGNWIKDGAVQKWYITEDKAYYGNSTITAIDCYIVGPYLWMTDKTSVSCYVGVSGSDLVGGFYWSTASAITLTPSTYCVLTVEGEVVQFVANGSAPDSSLINVPTAPSGKEFDKWVLAGTDTEFVVTANMTANASIVAAWKDSTVATSAEFVGNCTLPANGFLGGGETVVKLVVDINAKTITYTLADNTTKEKTVSGDNTNEAGKPQDYGADAYYFECKIGNVVYQFLIKSDLSMLKLFNSSDVAISNGVFTNSANSSTGGGYAEVELSSMVGKVFVADEAFYTITSSYAAIQINKASEIKLKTSADAGIGRTYTLQSQSDNQFTYKCSSYGATDQITIAFIENGGSYQLVIVSIVDSSNGSTLGDGTFPKTLDQN